MKNVFVINPTLSETIIDIANLFGLSQEELLEQAINLFLDWREFNFCKPLNDDEKLRQIQQFADKVFGDEPNHRCC